MRPFCVDIRSGSFTRLAFLFWQYAIMGDARAMERQFSGHILTNGHCDFNASGVQLKVNDYQKQPADTSKVETSEPSSIDPENQGEEEEKKTQWGSIWLASIILFLIALQFSVYFSSMWPFMRKVDCGISQTFYGFTLAAWSFGQMVASPLFGYWNARAKRARQVIAVGVIFSIVGNLLYLFTEAVPSNGKWMIFFGRFLCGIAGGVAGTVRGYVATASAPKDQHRAVSIGTICWQLGISGGPTIQAALTPIGYPALVAGPIHLNEFTAAAYISILAAVILMVLLLTVFKEQYIGVDTRKDVDPFHYVPKPDYRAATILLMCWFSAFFMLTNNDTVESPYTMATFNWNDNDATLYNGIIMGVSTFLGFILYIVFTLNARRINERASIIAGLVFLFCFYVFTFSWPFYTEKLNFRAQGDDSCATTNSTIPDTGGCDSYMEWCNYTPRLPLPVYLVVYPFISLGFPMCNICVATLYAKVLGPRRQGFMQSMMVMSGSTARTIGPIVISWLFSEYGPRVAWCLTNAIIAISIFWVIIEYDRLVPLKMRPKMGSGDKLKYDGGTLYRF